MKVPHWMSMAMPEDVQQIACLVQLQYRTPRQRELAMTYALRELRRTQWDRVPRRPARKPAGLRPSKTATSGYRTDAAAHVAAYQRRK